ncbi:MAG: PilZ domain-containing protein [Desulfatiglandaceae bacterium]
MGTVTKRRRARRFQIPGGKGRLKRAGVLSFFARFSGPLPVLNVSKGGLAIKSEKKFRRGQKIKVQLLTPNEGPLNLKGRVGWQEESADDFYTVVGIEFMPFGNGFGWNSLKALDVLRRMEDRYRK